MAVLLVMVYHAGIPLKNGFLGVDVFFVISGFLITGILVRELLTTGTISWARFVGRRIRRYQCGTNPCCYCCWPRHRLTWGPKHLHPSLASPRSLQQEQTGAGARKEWRHALLKAS